MVVPLLLLLVILSLVPVPMASAQSLTTLQQQQQVTRRLQQTRRKSYELRRKESSARGNLAGIKKNLNVTQGRLVVTQSQLTQAQTKLQSLQTRLVRLESQQDRQRQTSIERLRHLQRYGASQQWWAALLSSESFTDFVDRQLQMVRLLARDRSLILNLQDQTARVTSTRQAVSQQKDTIARLKSQLVIKKVSFQKAAVVQASQLNNITQQRVSYERAERQLEQDTRRLTGVIRRLIAERQRRNQASSSRSLGTGRFQRPVSGGRLTSNFGYRVHPIYRTKRFHGGVDFAAASGTPIKAADSGVVIYAGWYGGYGNAVVIDHGAGLATVYGHASRLYVRVGQMIQKGQRIAAVGSTGVSTGPHLHFEVRLQGRVVNPLGYL
ncbi:murein hydrolase activator EnvC [Candidatus Cyanaurora vandensis]|uniref:murein hydrolase activator EnvC family protein n=1 Tax=Candidatus Cyanaurora vandensis TaxID=2714958 RepID=UPI00257CB78D|nr:M23 family metallopeptidase [Candidatus Cyanaurora vandensis]